VLKFHASCTDWQTRGVTRVNRKKMQPKNASVCDCECDIRPRDDIALLAAWTAKNRLRNSASDTKLLSEKCANARTIWWLIRTCHFTARAYRTTYDRRRNRSRPHLHRVNTVLLQRRAINLRVVVTSICCQAKQAHLRLSVMRTNARSSVYIEHARSCCCA